MPFFYDMLIVLRHFDDTLKSNQVKLIIFYNFHTFKDSFLSVNAEREEIISDNNNSGTIYENFQ